MYHVFTYSCFFFRWNEKGLLNFVSERIKLVYRINNTRYNFRKNKLPFKHLKPQFIGRILSDLSLYLNINYCFKKYIHSRLQFLLNNLLHYNGLLRNLLFLITLLSLTICFSTCLNYVWYKNIGTLNVNELFWILQCNFNASV